MRYSSKGARSRRATIVVFLMHLTMRCRNSHAWVIPPSRTSFSRCWGSSPSTSQLPLVPERVAIIGGGLAGLSTAFHLLQKVPDAHITIFDKTEVGLGGASSVAGG